MATELLDTASANAGDGLVTPFAFSGLGNIRSIIIDYTGAGSLGIGFAFDNFSPPDLSSCFADPILCPDSRIPQLDDFVVPEPSTWALTMFGLGALAYHRRRKAQKQG